MRGHGIAKRFKFKNRIIKKKRLSKKASQPVKIRTVSNDNINLECEFNFIIFFDIERYTRPHARLHYEEITSFLSASASGKYKLVSTHWEKQRLIRLKLAEESDVFTFMLCHPANVIKILQIKR